ncbi:hypothetical protein [Rhizorhabdus sp.]|uniref:hypothetical protein n=1 Tax=Rhizorhabdus sp. TaxID=1968843 RepID=UPI0019C92166|nr:hypothetical protein [Rhizorhabdus sp.]MBD3761465.1 hypothetical protein [Rhizorhabdus sp.]
MGRHAKPKEEQRQQIGFRLSPADRHRLEAAASRSGVSVPQEVEVRLISSLDQDEMIDGPTAELIGQIAAQIAEIQKMTGKRWHKDVTTWAAVHEMLRRGPMARAHPDRPLDDETVIAAGKKLAEIRAKKKALIEQLASRGIAVLEEAKIYKGGILGGWKNRTTEQAAIDAIEDEILRDHAGQVFEQIQALDAEEEAASSDYTDALSPYWDAERVGRRLYRENRRDAALRNMREGQPWEPFDLFPLVEVEY